MTGPEIRKRLLEIATRQAEIADALAAKRWVDHALRLKLAKELRGLAREVWVLGTISKRRAPVRRAPPQSRKMTPELSEKIAEYAADHPTLAMHRIGRQFGVNGGRVSEAVAGKRT